MKRFATGVFEKLVAVGLFAFIYWLLRDVFDHGSDFSLGVALLLSLPVAFYGLEEGA